ncbi:MAG: STAS domain-containing protein [bacterium]|nr:STAS domain-containing protein [bacterium]
MLTVSVNEHSNNIIVVHVDGAFNLGTISKVEDTWKQQVAKKPRIIAINCSCLEKIDSAAIGTLVKFFNTAVNRNIKLVLYDLNSSISKLFETARLNRFFTITSKRKFISDYLRKRKPNIRGVIERSPVPSRFF